MNEKKQLRKEMKDKLKKLSFPLYEDLSYQIATQLYNDQLWQNAETIGITISRKPEVDTFQLIRKAWEQGKKIAIPKCHPCSKELEFRSLTRFSQLEMVYSNLYEPNVSETSVVSYQEINLLIVPGLAYTQSGYRIGFGGGYYDRYLQVYKGNSLSLAFSFQVVPEIPLEPHDLPVSKLITDEGVIICGD